MHKRLLVSVLGYPNSGKSETWTNLFGSRQRTSTRERWLQLRGNTWIKVFLVNGSFEETGNSPDDVIPNDLPAIVLCSVQYHPNAMNTFNWFLEKEYEVFTQWINPSYRARTNYTDELNIISQLQAANRTSIAQRIGNSSNLNSRVNEVRNFLSGWVDGAGLVF
ncbi:MAG: hypothetical protein IIA45_04460 [Bacteroidetes bacterium]|nr:hypothetical protein [Bacteroidota bacterium]